MNITLCFLIREWPSRQGTLTECFTPSYTSHWEFAPSSLLMLSVVLFVTGRRKETTIETAVHLRATNLLFVS